MHSHRTIELNNYEYRQRTKHRPSLNNKSSQLTRPYCLKYPNNTLNVHFLASCPRLPTFAAQLRRPKNSVKNNLFLASIQICLISKVGTRNRIYKKKLGNGYEMVNDLCTQVRTQKGYLIPTVRWIGNRTKSEFRVDPCC